MKKKRRSAAAQRRRRTMVRGAAVLLCAAGVSAAHGQAATQPTTQPATQPATRPAEGNPPAPGFDTEGSDARAVEIADRVMEAMGGRAAWDRTRYITWRFGPHRRHLWDKHKQRLRLEGRGPRTGRPYVMLIDLAERSGRGWQGGEPTVDPAALDAMIEAGISRWINDSYWLVMPYKLKDTGVTLTWVGEGETEAGATADILQLTFTDVGDTPQNKYHVWVGRESGLVEQWAFFATAGDSEPAFVCPWRDWKRYGRILLSGDRGTVRGRPFVLEEIGVFDELPQSYFTSPDPIDWDDLLSSQPG